MHLISAFLVPFAAKLTSAWNPPTYDGYRLAWSDDFSGANSGQLPNQNTWNIRDGDLNVNNELETYRASPQNVQLTNGDTLQIVPWQNSSAKHGWTSGRIESKYTFTPELGKRTVAEAEIRFGSNPTDTKQGIWPAFWLLGDSIRHGTGWPGCGELDIMETVNGQLTGYGTIHCDVSPGGICNEPNGRGATVAIPSQDWQLWRIIWDRASNASDWRSESITFYENSKQYHRVTGDQIGNSNVWASLAQRPLFFILNVAVGGDWPGNPNNSTLDGYGAMMEVGYVAQYVST